MINYVVIDNSQQPPKGSGSSMVGKSGADLEQRATHIFTIPTNTARC